MFNQFLAHDDKNGEGYIAVVVNGTSVFRHRFPFHRAVDTTALLLDDSCNSELDSAHEIIRIGLLWLEISCNVGCMIWCCGS